MAFPRSSGVLLHPTSLPGGFGIGDLGPSAFEFIDLLASAGQRLWQVLPLGPTGYGDSPYQCLSVFAGNPLLVNLQLLRESGLLEQDELAPAQALAKDVVDYAAVSAFKRPLLDLAHARFQERAPAEAREAFAAFCLENAGWLDDFALFMAVKDAHGGRRWTEWDAGIAARRPAELERWSRECSGAVAERKFEQFLFFGQWTSLRDACRRQGIAIMGDIPIFAAHDSADVWAHRELF